MPRCASPASIPIPRPSSGQSRRLVAGGVGRVWRAAGVRAAPIASEYTTAQPPSKANVEWRRFLAVAEPLADGSGWFDPTAEPDMPSGVSGDDWQRVLDDCGHLGREAKT